MAEKKEKLKNKLLKRYRLVVMNNDDFEEVRHLVTTKLQVFSVGLVGTTLMFVLVFLLLIYTPIRGILPAYTDTLMQQDIMENALRADSLERSIKLQEDYVTNIKNIIEGKVVTDFPLPSDTLVNLSEIVFTKSKHDSILRKQIEEEEKFNLSMLDNQTGGSFNSLHFFLPVKGMITNKFNTNDKHYAVDLASAPNEPILAVLDGTVLVSDWTISTGHVIQVQHANNLVSMYKHCSALLKVVGDRVKAGEAIAIIGNSGELSTGPHLHFELWHNGNPLNPTDYIVF